MPCCGCAGASADLHNRRVDLAALEASARERLPDATYSYLAGGADDELSLADNVAAWSRYRLRPHVLRDVSAVDLSTSLLGAPVSSPIQVAPTAYHRLFHADGEAATAKGAAAAGSVFTLSTVSTVSIEDVASAVPDEGRLWFQLYVHADRELTIWLVQRAEAAGYGALVLTVDTPAIGRRRRDGVAGFTLPPGIEPVNMIGYQESPTEPTNLVAYATSAFDPSLTMEAISWLREHTSLPIVVKGVLRGDDAASCVAAGARAVQVSNHGGRQLDGVLATADALAEVVAAVGDRAEVYVDGGIRRGSDVLRALALGARSVFVGRPVLWGLADNGAEGAGAVLTGLAAETALAFQLAGVRSCAEAGPDLVV
jgi:4-hydroxymandelate oxidase